MDERDTHEPAVRRMRWMEQIQSLAAFLRSRASAGDLEDVYQEVLLAVHRVRHTYDARRPFEPWLFAIARFVARHAGTAA